ncbi:Tol-Pal system protein TolB [Campylobacter sp. RM9344]|uniref:Tol-Pal system protein TolB n=2 Tax=Campylobacter californiensis TaxID=1032243 RepID=A0AAW3ZTJ9_9BACT|nr:MULTISPECIES: Tol-Pal system protein TolB [unclassified Campylobacter]MBE2984405.1 Tol-Pal system protein TolB [Campylobacter sp. RM6883]MBE2985743.1 Tol-Pal system protein TolB [Campylobacter sp. RM12919]MBE2995840.1 Tol-Pal system protein TolB [Campylobacter sp. RM6913]MBE3029671.1 Tol-Pal system protein TolB [Campylobacter sp. RM9344]MBE3607156.1 Tol-Pal system protein TolB [Campylobacter sp. RM9337]
MKKIVLFLCCTLWLYAADATMSIINQGIALPKIALQDATTAVSDPSFKEKFFKIMLGDLKVSSDFEVIEEHIASTYEGTAETNTMGGKGVELIFRYALEGSANSPLTLKVKLINAKTASVKYERIYTMPDGAKYPFLAHKSIVELTNELNLPPVGWMEKFIIFSKYTSARQSSIVVADYTLTYQKTIVSGGLNIFPKWGGADQTKFYYTSYVNNKPTLFRYDLSNGTKSKIIDSNGMLIASDVSKDGNTILLTMAPKDQPDIYTYNIASKKLTQVTNYPGIDVNGNFVDADQRVVFVSDRLGYPNVFAINSNGSGSVEQMVFHGKNNNSVSTFENYIVYSSREDNNDAGTFNIYLISTKTDFIRQLTASGKNNYPRFSSDGQSVVFIKQLGSQSSLGVIRLNENRSFQFPLKIGKIQSIDW